MGRSNVTGNNESGNTEIVDMGEAVDSAINKLKKLMDAENSGVKGSVTDLIRLLQLRKELEGERPRKVTVRWIEEECDNLTEE